MHFPRNISRTWSRNLLSTYHSAMTKECQWQILNMSLMPLCHWQAACAYQLCAPSTGYEGNKKNIFKTSLFETKKLARGWKKGAVFCLFFLFFNQNFQKFVKAENWAILLKLSNHIFYHLHALLSLIGSVTRCKSLYSHLWMPVNKISSFCLNRNAQA